jgi:N-acetylglucosaminyldiphosphoundecaprenol N-acetyl-beta-D-mannosaminyltransferase
MEAIKRIDVLSCPFDAVSFAETVGLMKRAVLEDTRLHIATGNIDFVMKAKRDAQYAAELWQADLIVADGVPILWAAALLGTPLRGRVNGTDLVWQCAQLAAETGCGVALLGAGPGVAMRAAMKMRERFPQAPVYPIATPFQLGEKENAELVEQIRAVKAKIVLAALGAPKQERWLKTYMPACGANVGIGCGSALDIICGDMPRAPRWMRDNGLEWFHRMLLEPKRLGRRYLIEDSPFILHLLAAWARRRLLGEAGKT